MNRLFPSIMLFLLILVSCESDQKVESETEEPEKPKVYHKFSESTSQHLESHFDSLFTHGAFNGVVLAYENDSLLKFARGFRSFESMDTLLVDDKFQLASVSKPLTAYAVLQLADRGLIDLDHYVSRYIKGFDYPEVTVRMLLNHTSGLGNYTYVTDSLWAMPDSVMLNDDLLREFMLGHVPIYYLPGQQFDYCNSNYTILANIIDCVAEADFNFYMKNQVFSELGMDSAELLYPIEKTCLGYKVQGHYPNGKNKWPFYLNGITGDKGVYANVDDLIAFYNEWKQPEHISKDQLSKSFRNAVKSDRDQFYALGWRLKPQADGDTLVFHNGWWRGFRTYFWWSKQNDKCFIALTNSIKGGYLKAEEIFHLY